MIRIKIEIEDVGSTLLDRRGTTFFLNEKYDRAEWTLVIAEARKYLEEIRDIVIGPVITTGGKNEVENERKDNGWKKYHEQACEAKVKTVKQTERFVHLKCTGCGSECWHYF